MKSIKKQVNFWEPIAISLFDFYTYLYKLNIIRSNTRLPLSLVERKASSESVLTGGARRQAVELLRELVALVRERAPPPPHHAPEHLAPLHHHRL